MLTLFGVSVARAPNSRLFQGRWQAQRLFALDVASGNAGDRPSRSGGVLIGAPATIGPKLPPRFDAFRFQRDRKLPTRPILRKLTS